MDRALTEPVAGSSPQPEGPFQHLRALFPVVDQRQLGREVLVQLGLLRQAQWCREAQRATVLGGRLVMGPQRRRLARRHRSMPLHGGGIGRHLGVIGEAGLIRRPIGIALQRRQGEAVQGDPPMDRDRLLHGAAAQLVAEAPGEPIFDQSSGRDAGVDRARRGPRHGLEQARLDVGADHRRGLERPARLLGQAGRPRQDHVTDGGGDRG